MNSLLQRVLLFILLSLVAGCSGVNRSVDGVKNSVNGWFGGSSKSLNASAAGKAAEEDSEDTQLKYAATVRISGYADQRRGGKPRLLGMNTQNIYGLDKGQLWSDHDVADLVASAFKQRFDKAGFQVLEGVNAGNAMFEVSGVIRELTLNVGDRDEIRIAIETTVKESATGKVIWSGSVTEKNDHYAGVSGNSKRDVVAFLNEELQVVSKKTVNAISAALLAMQPAVMSQMPGSKPVSGVTVNVAPNIAPAAVPVIAPVASTAPVPVAVPASAPSSAAPASAAVQTPEYVPHASATAGLLVVNTTPSRAKVYLDGVYFGMTPLRSEMKPSVHNVTVKLDGYKAVTEKISIRKGENTELELNLAR